MEVRLCYLQVYAETQHLLNRLRFLTVFVQVHDFLLSYLKCRFLILVFWFIG